jgi:hypothetical protein
MLARPVVHLPRPRRIPIAVPIPRAIGQPGANREAVAAPPAIPIPTSLES